MYDFQRNNSCVDFGVKKSQYLWHQWDGTPWQGGRFLLKIRWDPCLGSVPSYSAWIWIGFGERWSSIAWFLADLNVHCACAAGIECKLFWNADTLTKPFWRYSITSVKFLLPQRIVNLNMLDWSNISHVYLCTIFSHGGTRASNWS